MTEFGSPFTGLALKRKLTKSEVVRAIRFAVASEYESTQVKKVPIWMLLNRAFKQTYQFVKPQLEE